MGNTATLLPIPQRGVGRIFNHPVALRFSSFAAVMVSGLMLRDHSWWWCSGAGKLLTSCTVAPALELIHSSAFKSLNHPNPHFKSNISNNPENRLASHLPLLYFLTRSSQCRQVHLSLWKTSLRSFLCFLTGPAWINRPTGQHQNRLIKTTYKTTQLWANGI